MTSKHNVTYIKPEQAVYYNKNKNVFPKCTPIKPVNSSAPIKVSSLARAGIKLINYPITSKNPLSQVPQIITESQFSELQKAQVISTPIKAHHVTPIKNAIGQIKTEIVTIPANSSHVVAYSTPKTVYPSVLKSRKRPADQIYSTPSKTPRTKVEKGKGLRHFSMKVCEKVKQKGVTSYNEVADELVQEFLSMRCTDKNYDPNIRRRVYDALNVLMAMNIISKQKKEIRWVGLPTNAVSELAAITNERDELKKAVELKTQHLKDLIIQQVAFKNLVARNEERHLTHGQPHSDSVIYLPFVIINSKNNTVVDCSISQDKYEYMFHFNKRFEIYDDIDIMRKMGLVLGLDTGTTTPHQLQLALNLVPDTLKKYVRLLASNRLIKEERSNSPLLSQITDYADSEGDAHSASANSACSAASSSSPSLSSSSTTLTGDPNMAASGAIVCNGNMAAIDAVINAADRFPVDSLSTSLSTSLSSSLSTSLSTSLSSYSYSASSHNTSTPMAYSSPSHHHPQHQHQPPHTTPHTRRFHSRHICIELLTLLLTPHLY